MKLMKRIKTTRLLLFTSAPEGLPAGVQIREGSVFVVSDADAKALVKNREAEILGDVDDEKAEGDVHEEEEETSEDEEEEEEAAPTKRTKKIKKSRR
jgi:hypothetical protein